MSGAIFRAIWPVLDETTPTRELLSDAAADLPAIVRRAHAELMSGPRWSIQPGAQIPGSGGAHFVVVAEAVARPIERLAK